MQPVDWTKPIRDEIEEATANMLTHMENVKKYREMAVGINSYEPSDEYWKIMKLVQHEEYCIYREHYRINALRRDMNFDLGRYDDVYDDYETNDEDSDDDE